MGNNLPHDLDSAENRQARIDAERGFLRRHLEAGDAWDRMQAECDAKTDAASRAWNEANAQ